MLIKQVSVFVENKSGKLAEVIDTIGENNIDIYALSIADTTDFGVVRLIVSDPDKTKEVLKAKGMVVKRTEVLTVVIEDKPGGLTKVLSTLKDNGIGIEYLYAFIGKNSQGANVVMKVDDTEKAMQVLDEKNISVVSAEDLYR